MNPAHLLPAALLAVLCTTAARSAAPDIPLAAHHAVYDLALDHVQGSGTIAASGSMSYQVIDACTSWATQQQLKLRMVSRDGGSRELVSDYATLESKDGRHLTFDMKQLSDGAVSEQLRGEAVVDASGAGRVRYSLPQHLVVTLPPGTLFPMAHTAAIIHAARAGLKSLAPALFDGTGTDAEDTYVTILGWHPAPSVSSHPELAALGSSQVHVAFFSRKPDAITPDYESAMRYFDNGVADRLIMDFGDFSMKGSLRALTLSKQPGRC